MKEERWSTNGLVAYALM